MYCWIFCLKQTITAMFHPMKSQFINNTGKAAQITMPSIEDLLGDKLTAFAPNTTGVPYVRNENSMSMEIIK